VFALAEPRLGPAEWTVGRYSIADIHLFRLYWRFVTTLNLPLETYPNCRRIPPHAGAAAVQRTLEAEAAIGYNLPA